MRGWLALGVPIFVSLLSGCHFIRGKTGCHAAQAYIQAEQRTALKIPAGLDTPSTSSSLVIPSVEGALIPRGPKETCLEEPPQALLKKPLPQS